MKKSEAQRILDQLRLDRDILDAAIARIEAVQARVTPRVKKPRKLADVLSGARTGTDTKAG